MSDVTYDGQKLTIRPLKGTPNKSAIVLASLKTLRPTQLMKTVEHTAETLFNTSAV